MKKLLAVLLAAMMLFSAAAPAFAATEDEMTAYRLVSEDRLRYGLTVPQLDEELCRIARIKANDMLQNGYFAHTSPTYGNVRTMLTSFGYSYAGASENIARSRTLQHAEAAFLSSSSGHRTTLLGRQWTHMGTCVARTQAGFVYVVQIFVRK